MPAPLPTECCERLQILLASEQIPSISEDILDWRMVITMRDALREAANQASVETKENEGRRPFDPVRDLNPLGIQFSKGDPMPEGQHPTRWRLCKNWIVGSSANASRTSQALKVNMEVFCTELGEEPPVTS
ncbi:hypothetical protein M011DRAFT_524739, partial [Sporormia fimetaria CBS 119925]